MNNKNWVKKLKPASQSMKIENVGIIPINVEEIKCSVFSTNKRYPFCLHRLFVHVISKYPLPSLTSSRHW